MPAGLSGLMVLSLLAGPHAGPSPQLNPRVKAGLDAAVLAALQANTPRIVVSVDERPTDCRMIQPVPQDFTSKMPVATPDPNTKYLVRIVPVPSCATRK